MPPFQDLDLDNDIRSRSEEKLLEVNKGLCVELRNEFCERLHKKEKNCNG